MKKRQQHILKYIIEGNNCSVEEIINIFKVSKRTLYYDLEEINYSIRNHGQIKNLNHELCYVGNIKVMESFLKTDHMEVMDANERYNYILYKILNYDLPSIQTLQKRLYVSKNTVVQTLQRIRDELKRDGLILVYKQRYEIIGNEDVIRDLFIELMYEDNNVMSQINDDVLNFNMKNELALSDFSLGLLSKYISFAKKRMHRNHYVLKDLSRQVKDLDFYESACHLLEASKASENAYLVAFVSSLTSLKADDKTTVVDEGITRLIQRFEVMAAVELESKEEFQKNIKRHLLSSYYRIKFKFPIKNLSLEEIKYKHSSLFTIIKTILEDEIIFPEFKGIREEEIGFLAAYFGGYLKTINAQKQKRNKILIVCPHGLMVSKTLEIQLYQSIPTIEVVESISYQQLKNYKKEYDYIVSTMEIEGYENVIVVSPLLTKNDISNLMDKCFGKIVFEEKRSIDEILEVVKNSCVIENEKKLIRELEKLLNKQKEEGYQPMLKELISEKRIQIVEQVSNWEQAIEMASQPLLHEDAITEEYICQMIDSIKENGPYIVLADRFALPHASNTGGVKTLSMSILVVKEEVDLMGKPVNIFAVLAPIDSTSHLKALASLAELFYDEKNLEKIRFGNKSSILELLSQ